MTIVTKSLLHIHCFEFFLQKMSAELELNRDSEKMQFIVNFNLPNSCFICKRAFEKEENSDEEKDQICQMQTIFPHVDDDQMQTFFPKFFRSKKGKVVPFPLHKVCFGENHKQLSFECLKRSEKDQGLRDHAKNIFESCENKMCIFTAICHELFEKGNLDCYQRVCYDCFEEKITESLQNPKEICNEESHFYVKCPICHKNRIITRMLYDDLQFKVMNALDKEKEKRTKICSYCPITGCDYKENGVVDGTNCPKHFYHCAKCWESLTISERAVHECKGIPQELEDFEQKDRFCRCTKCQMLFLHTEGCSHVSCERCWTKFHFSPPPLGPDETDVWLVMQQTNTKKSQAEAALFKNRGDIVNAIMDLTEYTYQ